MKKNRMKTSLKLPEDLWRRAKIRAIEEDIDAQDLVAKAIDDYLKKGRRS